MRVSVLHDFPSDESLSAAPQTEGGSFFTSVEWFGHIKQHIPLQGGEIVTLRCTEGDSVTALLPWIRYERDRTAWPVARGLRSLGSEYSPIYDVCRTTSNCSPSIHHFVVGAADFFNGFDFIDAFPLPAATVGEWHEALNDLGFDCRSSKCGLDWYEEGIIDFNSYWSRRPKDWKAKVEQQTEQLESLRGFAWDLDEPKTEIDLLKKLSHYHNIAQESGDVVATFPGFVDSVCISAWRAGQLRLGVAYCQDIPIAAQIWFVAHRRASLFGQSVRRNQLVGPVKATSSTLTAHLVDEVINRDRVQCLDLLTGDDAEKRCWAGECRDLFRLQAVHRRSLRGLARSILHQRFRAKDGAILLTPDRRRRQ